MQATGNWQPTDRPAKILIVDDNDANRTYLCELMNQIGHIPHAVENGNHALIAVAAKTPDLILSDLVMPDMNGHELLIRLKQHSQWRHIPVLMISAFNDIHHICKCIAAGAEDYLAKPFNITLLESRISSALERKYLRDQEVEHKRQIERFNSHLEERIQKQVRLTTSAQDATIFALAKLTELKDDDTGSHLWRMREYTKLLTRSYQLQQSKNIDDNLAYANTIITASILHDIGKVGIADSILLKPGPLTLEEFDIIKTHTVIGAETLNSVHEKHPDNIFIQTGIEIARHHHEAWDGSGYPDGLAGPEIPLSARIVTVADVYDALTSTRCYKEKISHAESVRIILEEKGRKFDPQVVETFEKCISAFAEVSTQPVGKIINTDMESA
jgi:putative two-component system response regulator